MFYHLYLPYQFDKIMHTNINLILENISNEFSFKNGEKKTSKYLKLASFIRDKIEKRKP